MIDIGTDPPEYLNDISIMVTTDSYLVFDVDGDYKTSESFPFHLSGVRGAAAAAAKYACFAATGKSKGGWDTGKAPAEDQGLEDFLYNTDINRVVIDVTSYEDRATLLAQAMCDWFTF